MMHLRRSIDFGRTARGLVAAAALGLALLVGAIAPASATLLPEGFFDSHVKLAGGAAAVEADRLAYDAKTQTISAEGSVMMSYQGITIKADKVDYNQSSGHLQASGNVTVTDAAGDVFTMDTIEVTGGMKEAFINSLTLTTSQGAVVTARDVHYTEALETVLSEASYSPCGLCIDSNGRHIGWSVKAAKITYDRNHASVTLEQPSLALLGIPVAWIPWLWVPDPTQPRATGFRMPQFDWNGQRGASVTVPFFVPVGENVDFILSPELMTRQGALMSASVDWRLPGFGEMTLDASGLYQLDKSAYAGTVGDRDWRGAIQTSGHFTPAKNWNAGWSYSIFSDNQYLKDYEFNDADSSTNQVFGTYLDEMTYFDVRLQKFNRLGNYTTASDAQQGLNLPKAVFDHTQDLAPGWGRVHVQGELLAVHRDDNQAKVYGGVPYVFGYSGNKQHLMIEAAWEDQIILPGGVTATPYLGARLDAAHYDGSSVLPSAPPDSTLLSATPIAAMDFRWPLIATNGPDSHLLEPVAQLVYRGSSDTLIGITNDDSQSFVFDTSNLFDYNKFSGIDRQETGLRANVGGHYLGNFADGSWLDFVAGQSFQLTGLNAFGVADPAQVGTSTGLGGNASFLVASARGGFSGGLSGGGKIQVDPGAMAVTRAGVGAKYDSPWGWSAGSEYIYVKADPALGTLFDQHELRVYGTTPLPFDYWSIYGGTTWDLAKSNWIEFNGGVTYDDKYLLLGADANVDQDSWGLGVRFKLKGPDGKDAF